MGHPQSCKDPENCNLRYVEHLRGFSLTSEAMPTRGKNHEVVRTNIREKRWMRDIPAFKRLTKEGYDVPQIDGSALREKQGETPFDLEHRKVTIDYEDGSG